VEIKNMEYQQIKNLKAKVKNVLEKYPETRNCDIQLTIQIWKEYYAQYIFEDCVALKNLFELPREDNVKRIRAYFQNVKKLFLPTDWIVAKKRGIIQDEWRVAMGYPTQDTTGTATPSWQPPSERYWVDEKGNKHKI
jgi:hypothetical protein